MDDEVEIAPQIPDIGSLIARTGFQMDACLPSPGDSAVSFVGIATPLPYQRCLFLFWSFDSAWIFWNVLHGHEKTARRVIFFPLTPKALLP